MHRALTVAVVLAVVAGSVPAAASLADGTPSTPQPGASFAGVVGVQGAEVDNEMANRSLSQQLRAAESNRSTARVVASESQQLSERLAELEAQKARLQAAYENGSISKGQYTARLAVLAAELRAVERRANRTAGVAEKLPKEALQEAGANVSHIHQIAQHANRTGGGEVAEAARQIAGGGVGNGLGSPPAHAGPPNGSETGPPESTGPPENAGDAGNAGPPTDSPSVNASNRSNGGQQAENAANANGRADSPSSGNVSSPSRATNATNQSAAGGANSAPGKATNVSNGSAPGRPGNVSVGPKNGTQNGSNASANESASAVFPWQGVGNGRQRTGGSGNETATDAESVGRAAFSLSAAP